MALQIWVAFLKDQKDAWQKYLAFVKQGGTRTFVDLVRSVGLISPMDDGCVASISSVVSDWLKEHQI